VEGGGGAEKELNKWHVISYKSTKKQLQVFITKTDTDIKKI
jgi:hypothetical protein